MSFGRDDGGKERGGRGGRTIREDLLEDEGVSLRERDHVGLGGGIDWRRHGGRRRST